MEKKHWGLTLGIVLLGASVVALIGIQIVDQFAKFRSGAKPDPNVIAQVIANAIAMTGLILVLFTLRARLDTNRIQVESLKNDIENQRVIREVELLCHFLEELRQDISSLTFPVEFRNIKEKDKPGERQAIKGKEAVEFFVNLFETDQDHTPLVYHSFFYDLYFIIGSFNTFRNRIIETALPPFEQNHLISRMCFLYTSRFMKGLTNLLVASESGKLKLKVETATGTDAAQLLRKVLSAHKRMIAFIQKHQV